MNNNNNNNNNNNDNISNSLIIGNDFISRIRVFNDYIYIIFFNKSYNGTNGYNN